MEFKSLTGESMVYIRENFLWSLTLAVIMALEMDSVSPWKVPFRLSLLEKVAFKDTTTNAKFIASFYPALGRVAYLSPGTSLEIISIGFIESIDFPSFICDYGYFLAVQVNANGKRPILNYQCGDNDRLQIADFYMQFSAEDYLEQKIRLAEMPAFDALCLAQHHTEIVQINDAKSAEIYFRQYSLLNQIRTAVQKKGIDLKLP